MHELIALGIVCVAMAGLFLGRRRLGIFWSASGFLACAMAYMVFGFDPGLPQSVQFLYGWTSVIAVMLYITSSEVGRDQFLTPIIATMVDPKRRGLLGVVLLLIPSVVAFRTYTAALPSASPPAMIRSVHPSPPSTITFRPPGATDDRTIDLSLGDNPNRALKTEDPEAYAEAVELGKTVYYQNCFYCHGDQLAADGHFATAMKPPPATFQNAGVLPALQSTFLFWRIAKGGLGLPAEGTPWDSAMPVWENFLSENEIWAVLSFLSDFTGYDTRSNAPAEAGGGH